MESFHGVQRGVYGVFLCVPAGVAERNQLVGVEGAFDQAGLVNDAAKMLKVVGHLGVTVGMPQRYQRVVKIG